MRYAVGIVNYRTHDDLDRCLTSVKLQTLAPSAVIAIDVEPDEADRQRLVRTHPEVEWRFAQNSGFAANANAILGWARESVPAVDFVLILNPDVWLDPDFCERLIEEVESRPEVAIATGKLLRPNGFTLDSAGITLPYHRRPRDRGSECHDLGQYDRVEYVFAATGAAMMFRCSALDELSIQGEVFDEDFFLYHEDTDLAWRASLFGWKTLYVPAARAIHRRGWRRNRRFSIHPMLRRHSFKNHYLQMVKNERALDFWTHFPVTACWEVARLGFALCRDRAVLGAYRDALRFLPSAWRKRREVQRRARAIRRGVRRKRGDGSVSGILAERQGADAHP